MRTLEVIAIFATAFAMSLAIAHALEWPGKRRLDRRSYLIVQTIYYPGFTFGGVSEIIGIALVLVLIWWRSRETAPVAWTIAAFACLVAMHVVFWIVTQPVNKFWLLDTTLSPTGAKFFGTGDSDRQRSAATDADIWLRLRTRWEYSHIVRAILGSVALIALLIAVTA